MRFKGLIAILIAAMFAGVAGAQERRLPTQAELRLSYAPVVQHVAPAVVNVYAAKVVQNRNPLLDDPIFRRFFGVPGGGGNELQRSLGSGVIIDAAGLVVTNNHVIEGADEVKVSLADKREFEATLVLKDQRTDPDDLAGHVATVASRRAYEQAGLGPEDVDVVECHDATAFGELLQSETLGFYRLGEGGPAAERGETALGGRIPFNPSGGLESRGHPIGATGLAQVFELVQQLRGECGPRQVEGARVALAENGGGLRGIEEAAMAITVLEAPERSRTERSRP